MQYKQGVHLTDTEELRQIADPVLSAWHQAIPEVNRSDFSKLIEVATVYGATEGSKPSIN